MALDISFGSFPEADKYFGHADYYHHKGKGMSAQELLNWVGNNFEKFSPGVKNQPGGGGLYDQMVADANMEKFIAQTQAQNAQLSKDFEARMAALNEKMMGQQKTYDSSLAEMTNTLKGSQQAFADSQKALLDSEAKGRKERELLMKKMNPNIRAASMGVRSAQANRTPAMQTIRGQGMAGQFSREGLRIKNMNV